MYVSILYLTLFILSLIATYFLLRNVSNKRSSYYVVLFTLIAIVCLAYFAYSSAIDSGMVLVANQFSYIDGTFVQMFFLFCVLDICGIQVKKSFGIPLVLVNLFFILVVFTTVRSGLLYKDYEIGFYNGASNIEPEFGPIHSVFIYWVIFNTLIPIGVIIYSIIRRKKISYLYTTALGILETATVATYFIEKAFDLGFDILPCIYVLMEYIILGIIQRVALYDGSQIVIYNSEDRREYGYIIFDIKKRYVGSNAVAKYYFPELDELTIDRHVNDGFVKEEFLDRLDESNSETVGSKVFSRAGRDVVCTFKPYRHGEKNKIYGYIVEIRDDTEQQQLIKELNKVNDELEDAVDNAISASRAKSDFLAKMSHEIRTPINAILGMNEIALRECMDDSIIPYLNDIQSAGKTLLYIINDILDFSKIEAGKIDIIEADYELASLINDVKNLVEVKAIEKNIELTLDIDQELPSVLYGDENRIRQIIINILNNAVKYTAEGRVELIIKSELLCDDEVTLGITVTDTGIGIKEEDIPVLFDSFSRVDEKVNREIEGTGLGLAITKRLIDMMNGTIDVESVYGEGTTFNVKIPQRIVSNVSIGNVEKQNNTVKVQRPVSEHIDASKLEILVVDDTTLNLTVAKGLLKATNAKVDTCTSGEECLNIIAQKHYDIILLDHMMPDMDGIETIHRAKELADSKCGDTVFIALTANAISGVRDMYIAEGFDDYISKPIDSKHLEETIKKHCL